VVHGTHRFAGLSGDLPLRLRRLLRGATSQNAGKNYPGASQHSNLL
jgi:hypothetical protein